jgi:hypothetical protein
LRDGGVERASFEIGRMREAWSALASRFGQPPAAVAKDLQLYRNTMVDVSTRLVTATLMLTVGRPHISRDALIAIRDELSQLRQANGIVVLADCVRDANAAMATLASLGESDMDWSDPSRRVEIDRQASAYRNALERCENLADVSTRREPEFRRLIDDATTELETFAKALAARDRDLLRRSLIELRSIDQLLTDRFG